MADSKLPGYVGKILRVDLSEKKIWEEKLDERTLKNGWRGWLGRQISLRRSPPGSGMVGSRNRLIWTTGPLAGSGVYGAATFNVTAKGPMTNLAGCLSGQWVSLELT